jgi:hypothetical protein
MGIVSRDEMIVGPEPVHGCRPFFIRSGATYSRPNRA